MSNGNPPSTPFQYFPIEKGTTMDNIDTTTLACGDHDEAEMTDEEIVAYRKYIARTVAEAPKDARKAFLKIVDKLEETGLLNWDTRLPLDEDDCLAVETPSCVIQVSGSSFYLELSGDLSSLDDPLEHVRAGLTNAIREIELAMFIREHS